MEAMRRLSSRSSLVVVSFVVLSLGAFLFTRYLDSSAALMDTNSSHKSILTGKAVDTDPAEAPPIRIEAPKTIHIALNCSMAGKPVCPASYYPTVMPAEYKPVSSTPSPSCPDYFRWIHDDLWPWRETGITREMVLRARRTANFRLIILNGKAYVERYVRSFQSRDTFTVWGILQLLRRYPGRVPDLDLMFDCVDWPVVKKGDFRGPDGQAPPPLFRYCGNNSTYDVVFPDWSFWGWPEINIKPWNELSKDLQDGNQRIKWTDREPHAFWKGNPAVAATRMDLLKCNVSDKQDWNARVYAQDWLKEQRDGYKNSDLASQCIHRYKIYIEGSAWSVSEKNILACNSLTLLVKPIYYDFFTRGLMPLKHFWPVKDDDKCRSIKHAVEWGNKHQKEAQAISKAASQFILEDVRMDFVYDYMFHLLSKYAKLLRYKPTIPKKAVELCSESMACNRKGLEKKFMMDSLVKGPAMSNPCTMPPPYDPAIFHSVIVRKENGVKQVESWEKEYWNKQIVP